jgi:2-oxoglutarate dehydrogenase E1 component
MGDHHFMRIKSDMTDIADTKVKRLVLCSGKVAYDLMQKRDEERLDDVSIIRIEQLYPFPGDALAVRLKRMKKLEDVVWCQEEPKNNGSWFFVDRLIEQSLSDAGHPGLRPIYAGRDASASPATGLAKRHQEQQEALIAEALGLNSKTNSSKSKG